MGFAVFVGAEGFDELRESGRYYADKTGLVSELVEEAGNKVTLITRPRRFGKTLALSMLESFFDIRRDSRAAFKGLEVTRHVDLCESWMNKHPVLFISFKDAEGLTFENAYRMLRSIVANACIKHAYLAKSTAVDEDDRATFIRLKGRAASKADLQNSLLVITRMMHAHFGAPAILLIDEYDVPLAKAAEQKEGGERYYPQMLEVIRGVMSTALKSNEHLKLAVVTGCLRIAKESIFTGVNNFASYSVFDARFSRYFGFTQGEVDELLGAAGLQGKAPVFREWYDGYAMGSTRMYCPWDVVSYVSDLMYRRNARPKNYWKNTSGNGIIREFAGRDDFQVKGKFETLLNGGAITQAVSDDMTYDTLRQAEENLWSVLVMTGYLTKANPDEEGETVSLRIPNKEIASIFQDAVVGLFAESVSQTEQRALMDALFVGDEESVSKALSDLLWRTISYNDYSEDYYHAFLAGVFVGRGFEVESNKERGLGRPDIRLLDHASRRALVIEAKRSTTAERMPADCEAALAQIVDNGYAAGLDGFTVTCYGIAFFKKTALVKRLVRAV